MRRSVGATAAFIILAPVLLSARNLQIIPTATLQFQLANNTSAANTFPNQTNGNMGGNSHQQIGCARVAISRFSQQSLCAFHAVVW